MAKPPAELGPTATAKIRPRTSKGGLRIGSNPGSKALPVTVPKTTTSPGAVTGLPGAPGVEARAAVGTPTAAVARLITLKRRSEFLRVRKGARFSAPAFVLEAKARANAESAAARDGARFGFTIARQVGKAVERNRIRRRLKAAIIGGAAARARRDFDYVVIARRAALTLPFGALVTDLIKALERIHRPARRGPTETGNTLAG
jgi:ribonuclease P protein component